MVILAVFAGGALGAVGRFVVSSRIQARMRDGFPRGTLAVNAAGCVLIGLLVPLTDRAPLAAAFFIAGCTGAFTTFSTFAHDAVILLRTRGRSQAALYAGASVALGVMGVAAGLLLARALG